MIKNKPGSAYHFGFNALHSSKCACVCVPLSLSPLAPKLTVRNAEMVMGSEDAARPQALQGRHRHTETELRGNERGK